MSITNAQKYILDIYKQIQPIQKTFFMAAINLFA